MALKRDKVLRDAEKLVQKNKVEQAIREYQKVLKVHPDDTTTINRVGDLYGRLGQVDKAIELYERIADHFTKDGFSTKAIAILKKINRLDPQRLDIFERLAELYVEQGLTVEAKREYQVLADWYMKHDEPEKAIGNLQKLVDLEPDNHASAIRLADLLLKRGDSEAALEVYDRLGRMLLDAKKLDEAERLYRHALEQEPPQGEFLVPVCTVFLDSGRAPVARELLNAGLQRSPDSVPLKALTVRSHLVLGDAKKAVEIAQEVLAADPSNLEIRNLVGAALLSAGEVTEARKMLLPAAEELLDKGDYKGAQEALQNLLKATPNDQQVLKVAVRAFRPSGDEETLFALSAALAESYFRSGEQEAAKRLYLQLLKSEPENQQFRQRLAMLDGIDVTEAVDLTVGEELPDEVVMEVEEEIEVSDLEIEASPEPEGDAVGAPETFDPAERLAEAGVFAKYGLVEKAINHLEEIVRSYPEQWDAREQLASLLVEQGDRDAAAAVARPLLEHHRDLGTLAELGALLDALPGHGEPPIELGGEEEPSKGETDLEPTAVEEASVSEPEVMVKFPDDDSDLVEVVDVEGDLVAEPEGEIEPSVEEFDIDYESEIDLFDKRAEAESEDEMAKAEVVDAPAAEIEEMIKSAVSEKAVAEEEPAAPAAIQEEVAEEEPAAPAAVQEEVAEELVEISESLAGPSFEDLQQIDFFIGQELYEDAARQLITLEEEHAEDPEVLARRLKLKEVGVLLEQVETVEEGSEELFADEEQYIDLAKELEAELAAEEAMVEEATGRGKGEALLEEVFREFQKGVAEQLSEEDSDTHFTLCIAYREMGLVPEAIREFQVASRDPSFFVESCSMIGVCYKDQGLWTEAADWYQKALVAPDITSDARIALRYDLALAYENAGELEQAISLYEEIAAADPTHRDVTERLSALSEQRQAN